MRKRTPQEKKKLSYEKDRRNAYGEAPHAARKNIPIRKALRNRANRHAANQPLRYQGQIPDSESLDELSSTIQQRRPTDWQKHPDQPLGQVIARRSGRRKIMRQSGGRDALITRTFLYPQSDDHAGDPMT